MRLDMHNAYQIQAASTIAFVEPHERFYKVLQDHLDSLHYNNTGFRSYSRALREIQNNPPTLIICEKSLADVNDIINYTILKRFAKQKKILIIHVTNDLDKKYLGIEVSNNIVKINCNGILQAKIRSTLNSL